MKVGKKECGETRRKIGKKSDSHEAVSQIYEVGYGENAKGETRCLRGERRSHRSLALVLFLRSFWWKWRCEETGEIH